jgi:hypothetical protein
LNDKHADKTNDRTKVECFPVGSGSESSLLVSSRHCKRRFRFIERSCADVMTKEMENDACKSKKNDKKTSGKQDAIRRGTLEDCML